MDPISQSLSYLARHSVLTEQQNGLYTFAVGGANFIFFTEPEGQVGYGKLHFDRSQYQVVFLSPVQGYDIKIECITMIALKNIEASHLIEVDASQKICLLDTYMVGRFKKIQGDQYESHHENPTWYTDYSQEFKKSLEKGQKSVVLHHLINLADEFDSSEKPIQGHEIDIPYALDFWQVSLPDFSELTSFSEDSSSSISSFSEEASSDEM